MCCGSPLFGTSGGIKKEDVSMKEYLNINFSDIVYGENGFLVELRCNNIFHEQLFGEIKTYLHKKRDRVEGSGSYPYP